MRPCTPFTVSRRKAGRPPSPRPPAAASTWSCTISSPVGTPTSNARAMAREADIVFAEIWVADYAAVLPLGGRAPESLRNDEGLLETLRPFDRPGKWIFSICHGVQILAAAGLADGRKVTCYHHVRRE